MEDGASVDACIRAVLSRQNSLLVTLRAACLVCSYLDLMHVVFACLVESYVDFAPLIVHM